jgi:DegV family protein with EDD domain
MTVKIITDSSAGLPESAVRELDITVVPVPVFFGEESYLDGIDMTTEQFYQRLVEDKAHPTTSVPAPATFAQFYDEVAQRADEIAVITISHKLSAIPEVARQSLKLVKQKRRIEVIDSNWALMAQGLLVITAAQVAKGGAGLDEVIALTHKNMGRVDIRIAFDTLEYLRRGGRIGRATAFLGSVLKINPILCIKDGETYPVAREHSRSKALEHLYDFAVSYRYIEELAIADATTPDEADRLAEQLDFKFPRERIYRTKVTPAVGTHVGPHVIAVAILGDRE